MQTKGISIASVLPPFICALLFFAPSTALAVPSLSAPTDLREEMSWYSNKSAGIMFLYPKKFSEAPKKEPDQLLKLEGKTASGLHGSIELSATQSDVGVDTLGKVFAETMHKHMPGYEPGQLEWVRFGRSLKLSGVTRVAKFKIGEAPFRQRVMHWSSQGRTYTFSLIGPESQWQMLDPLYNYILLSIAPFGASGGPAAAPKGDSPGASLAYSSWYKKGVGSFAYPSAWQVQDTLDPHVIVKIAGTDKSGKGGELFLTHHPHWDLLPLSQFADTVEKTYLKPLPKWTKLTDSSVTFGAGRRLEAMKRSGTMTLNGVPAMCHTAFWTDNGKHYCLSVATIGFSRQDADGMFSRVMQTLHIDETGSEAQEDAN